MKLPQIDLHLHLDGSLDPKLSYELAKERNLIEDETYEQFEKRMIAPANITHLHEYLQCFDLPIALLQDFKALKISSENLVERLAKQGVDYAEIRFAPQSHTKKLLTQEDALRAVISGVRDAVVRFPQIEINIILCMMIAADVKDNHEANMETIRIAKKYLHNGVVAIDLAGAEGLTPMENYRPYFEHAAYMGIPFTIHAGESGPAEHVACAIDFGAKRIGHGGHCLEDEKVIEKVLENNVTLEMCPTSNIHCKNQPSYAKHALKPLYERHVRTTINTDNMTLSHVTLADEYEHVLKEMHLEVKDILNMAEYAIEASFASNDKKNSVKRKIAQCRKELDGK